MFINGYTASPIEDDHLPIIDQALQVHEVQDFLEELEAYEENGNKDEEQFDFSWNIENTLFLTRKDWKC